MNLKWPYLAKGEDGLLYSPIEAKQTRQRYCLDLNPEIILTPVVGEFVTNHWRSSSDIDYTTIRGGYEMGYWHYNKQVDARDNLGYAIEHRLVIGDNVYYADAYDSSTNTIYEYVDTHYDNFKISEYFNSGYNQVWVFRDETPSYHLACESDFMSYQPKTEYTQELMAELSSLPSITIIKE